MSLNKRLEKLEKQFDPFPSDLTKLSDEELKELQKKLNAEHAKVFGQKDTDEFSGWIATLSLDELDKLKNIVNKLRYDPRRPPLTTENLQRLML